MPLYVSVTVNATSGLLTPVLAGLVLGALFIIAFSTFMRNPIPPMLSIAERFHDRVPIQDEFKTVEQVPEVKFLIDKYTNDVQPGFARSNDEKTIRYDYLIAEAIDTDGDGYKESVRHLDLILLYDESGGKIYKNPDAKLIQMKIECTQPSSSDIRTYIDVMPPVEDGKVMDFIQNEKCMF